MTHLRTVSSRRTGDTGPSVFHATLIRAASAARVKDGDVTSSTPIRRLRSRRDAPPTTRADAGLTRTISPPTGSTQFGRWLADAVAAGLPEPNAMVLATADADGRPSARPCCSRASTRGASRSSPTTPPARAPSWPRTRTPAWSSRGSRCTARWSWRARWRGCDRAETEAYFATPAARSPSSARGPARSPRSVPDRAELDVRWPRRPSASPTRADPGAAALGRVAGAPGDGGVLAGPDRPAARPAAIPRRRPAGHREARH